jgi:hypothetical protein
MTPEEQNAILKKAEEQAKKKFENIHITVDDTAMKEMVEKVAEVKEENEDLKERLSLIAEKEIEKKLSQHPELTQEQRIEFAQNPEALKAYEEGKNAQTGIPSGTAPLQSNYFEQFQKGQQNEDLLKRQWNSPEEMIMYLRANKSAQSEKILNELWKKTLEASTVHHVPMQYPPKDVEKEGKVPDRNFLNPDSVHETESELEKLGVQKNPLFYAQKNKAEFERLKKEQREKRTGK